MKVYEVALPADSVLAQLEATADLADAYMVRLPKNCIANPEALARFMFAQQAPWVTGLMGLRDSIVKTLRLNIATSSELKAMDTKGLRRIQFFKIYESNDKEVILGEDDSHLDFRLSVLYRKAEETQDNQAQLIVATVVHCHNRLGRNYLRFITPFHRAIVKSGLRRAIIKGFPSSSLENID